MAGLDYMQTHTHTHTFPLGCVPSIALVHCGLLQTADSLSHVCAEPDSQTPGRNSGSRSDQGASSDAWSCRDTALPLCEIRAALLRFKPGMTGEKHRHAHTHTNVRSSTEYRFTQMLWTGTNKTTKRNELKASRSGFYSSDVLIVLLH